MNCPDCNGTGVLTESETRVAEVCPNCRGLGTVDDVPADVPPDAPTPPTEV